jgi:hypothetical protein
VVEHLTLESPISDDIQCFPFPIGTFSIANSTLAMLNNSLYRIPKSDMSKLRCTHEFDPSTSRHLYRDFGLHRIVNPDVNVSRLLVAKPRNDVPPIPRHRHTNYLAVRISHFVISRFSLLCSRDFNPRNPNMRVHV